MQVATDALALTLSAQRLLCVDLTAVHLMLALPCRYMFRTCQVTQCGSERAIFTVHARCHLLCSTILAACLYDAHHSVCACQLRVQIFSYLWYQLPTAGHSCCHHLRIHILQVTGTRQLLCSCVLSCWNPSPILIGCACRTRLHPTNIADGSLYLSVTMLACSCLAKHLPALVAVAEARTCLP